MHIVHDAEFVSQAARGSGLISRTIAVLRAWQARERERRLLLSLNERLREDGGLDPATPHRSAS